MQNKLCVIISSEYAVGNSVSDEKDRARHKLWNAEVQQDLETVKKTLDDHRCIEIKIPAIANQQSMANIVREKLAEVQITQTTTCHIVLNTHGAAGSKDVSDEAVKMVVNDLSHKGVKITQLSALICNAMTALDANETQKMHDMTPANVHASARGKKATMEILQQKLNAVTTDTAQNFQIRGFDGSYNPIEAQDSISDLLLGEGGMVLDVNMQAPTPSIGYIEHAGQILHCINILREYRNIPESNLSKQDRSAYNSATNFLGALLTDMKNNVVEHLYHGVTLAYEDWGLLDTIRAYAQSKQPPLELETEKEFNLVYKQWLKENKIYSETRVTLFEGYALSLVEMENPEKMQDASSQQKAQSIRETLTAKHKLKALTHNVGYSISSSEIREENQNSLKKNNVSPHYAVFRMTFWGDTK